MSDPLTYAPDEPDGYKPCPLCGSTIPDEPNELDDLRGEVERLRAEADLLRTGREATRCYADRVEAEVLSLRGERAAVVAYLRRLLPNAQGTITKELLDTLADYIERGEHLHAEEP